ncbi:MAG TPA: substrate-binding domain-containing protein [Acidimicrobiales bacterium]|nr:substrate-binding domain-containing protein [Acidimicrobiales bacterium]
MRATLSRRARRVAVGGTAFVALATLAAACDYGPDGDPESLAVVGSDTTQDVMGAILASYEADTVYNDDTNIPGDDRDDLFNVLSVQPTPLTVTADEHCGDVTYHTPPGAGEVIAPNGSTAGRDALKNSPGCIDIARSSSGPRAVGTGAGQDPESFQYFAYALDAVGWSSASTAAPANLTLAQLRGIYNCTFTNWNQVGGADQAIERYYAQPGSGTRAFFQSDVLGFDPFLFSSPSCPLPIDAQENQGLTIAANGDQQSAIMPYSGANFIAMSNGVIPDQRAGQTIRNLDGQNITFNTGTSLVPNTPAASGNPAAPVQEANVRLVDSTPAYVGVRFVFNVADSASPSYNSALRYVGFDNVDSGSTSPLCSGGKASIVTSYGFGPLDGTIGPRNLAGSVCRLY